MTKTSSIKLMTEGNIAKTILAYAAPIFIGNLFQQLYNTADSLIVGNFVGQNALAAVTSIGPLTYLLIGFFMGFSTGGGVIIAREVGAKREEQASKAVHTLVALGLVLSCAMTIIGVFFTPILLEWMGTPSDVLPLAATYLRIYFAGSIALVMYNILVGILNAGGDSTHPLYYLIISSVINVIGDVILITQFHMGVAGAAVATIASQFFAMLLCLRRLLREESMIALHPHKIHFDRDMLKQIFNYGFPTAMQGCVIDLANIMIQSYYNSFGAAIVAGIGAYTKVEGFVFLPVTAFSMAMTTFISQNRGAGKHHRVKEGMRFGLIASAIVIELIGFIFFFFAPVFISAFNRTPEVIAAGASRARTCSLFYCCLGFSHIASAILRGEGRPIMPMAVMLICWCAVRVITLMTIGKVIHMIALANWLYPITWTLSSIVFAWDLRKYHPFSKEDVDPAMLGY